MSAVAASAAGFAAPALAPAPSAIAAEPMVRLDGLTKRFAVRRSVGAMLRRPFDNSRMLAVDGVSFDVARGELFGLLGPNGAGKSTLFRMLATLVVPDAGSALVDGWSVNAQPGEVRQTLAVVGAEERSLNWRLSARENLRLFASFHGLARATREARVAEVLEIVGLADTGAKLVGAFSSGMRQRLLIARALLPSPRVLLLDEPTRALDPISARQLRAFLRDELVSRHGRTALLATHNAEEAFDLCDRVGVLHRGRLLATGPADALARRWADPRYRLHVADPAHAAFAALERRGMLARAADAVRDDDGWWWVECEIAGGPAATAGVLAALAEQGVSVAACERVGLALADLIARIVGDAERAADA